MKVNQLRHAEGESKPETIDISIWIDSYSDIFSDFDPRSFSERTISDDFIAQVKKVSRDTKGKVSVLKLLVPMGMQKDDHEKNIKKRLQNYFYNIHQQLQEELRQAKVKGIYFSVTGVALMVIASYISFLKLSNFPVKLVLVLFEPGGWFLFWTGLDLLFSFSRSKKGEIDFYNRMSNVHVEFSSYK